MGIHIRPLVNGQVKKALGSDSSRAFLIGGTRSEVFAPVKMAASLRFGTSQLVLLVWLTLFFTAVVHNSEDAADTTSNGFNNLLQAITGESIPNMEEIPDSK